MGTRRMIDRTIIESRKFLELTNDAKVLYLYSITNTDDDGIFEAFRVMRLINATEDSFRNLVAKGFIVPLNDDLVCFVKDFFQQNTLQKDRIKPSIYRHLLLDSLKNNRLPKESKIGNHILIELEEENINIASITDPIWIRNRSKDKTNKVKIIESKVIPNEDKYKEYDFESFKNDIERELNRSISFEEIKEVKSYINNNKFSTLMLREAIREMVFQDKKSWGYFIGIIGNWIDESKLGSDE